MKKIVICAIQRCGSTMVCEDFRLTKVLGVPEEWFLPWRRINLDERNWDNELKLLQKKHITDNEVFSIKIMANQLRQADKKLSQSEHYKPNDSFKYLFSAFNDAFWIRIKRNDLVEQAISNVIAMQTNIFHATKNKNDHYFSTGKLMKGYKEDYNKGLEFDYKKINEQIKRIEKEEVIWDKFFYANSLNPYILIYEDIYKNQKYLEGVSQYVDIPLPQELPSRKSVKLSNQINQEWYDRYKSIENKSTGWIAKWLKFNRIKPKTYS